MIKKVAVLGAGNAGTSLGGHLALKGFDVRLFEIEKFKKNIDIINEKGGIEVTGVVEGFGKLEKATTNMSEAISGADLILIAVPAFAHETIANEYLKYAEKGQIVVFLPGNYSSLRFYKKLKDKGMEYSIHVLSTASMIYACRKIEANKVNIMAVKHKLPISSMPSHKTKDLVKELNKIFDEFVPAENVLQVSMNNLNCILHVPTSILNSGRIENTGGDFDFYWEGMTESVCRVIEEIDSERIFVGEKLGINLTSVKQLLYDYYLLDGNNLHEILTTSEVHGGTGSPDNLHHRYIVEDANFGLVPISSLGSHLGYDTPNTDSIINLASTLNNVNYSDEGITMEKLGLNNMNPSEIINYLMNG